MILRVDCCTRCLWWAAGQPAEGHAHCPACGAPVLARAFEDMELDLPTGERLVALVPVDVTRHDG